MADVNVHSLVRAFSELERIKAEEQVCSRCAYYEASPRGGPRHCALNMEPADANDGCEEWEPRLRKTRAGQRQLPLKLVGSE